MISGGPHSDRILELIIYPAICVRLAVSGGSAKS